MDNIFVIKILLGAPDHQNFALKFVGLLGFDPFALGVFIIPDCVLLG